MMMKLPSVRIDCKHELGGTKLLDGKYNDGGKLREELEKCRPDGEREREGGISASFFM